MRPRVTQYQASVTNPFESFTNNPRLDLSPLRLPKRRLLALVFDRPRKGGVELGCMLLSLYCSYRQLVEWFIDEHAMVINHIGGEV
jgi:hypothetical protein